MADNTPTFQLEGIVYAHEVLFQALLVQLMTTKVLSIEDAQRVFDAALQRAKRAHPPVPDGERAIQHMHDQMDWDSYYRWAAEQQADKGPGVP